MTVKEFLENLIKQIVDNPDEVKIDEVKGQNTTVYELEVHKDDVGKVLGRKGKTVQAVRTLLNAVGRKHGSQTMLEILDPRKQEHQ